WFIVAVIRYQVHSQWHQYSSPAWYVLEYLTLFLIVLIHEFGHALACKQVGGQANQILLWPLGGVAYVAPPQRPGAQLWSIAAGPLVHVLIFIALGVLMIFGGISFDPRGQPDAQAYLANVWWINTGLLVFNIFPVYPL